MKQRFLLLLSFFLLAGAMGSLFAQEEVVVINRTGYDIHFLFISPESSDSWGEDLLGDSEILTEGSHTSVSVPGMGNFCVFDLKAVDLDDDTYVQWGLNLCEKKKVVITMDDFYTEDPVTAGEAVQDFILVNNTGFIIRHIFISPDYSDNWEEDLLGESAVLSAGEGFPITFEGYGDHCIFDMKIVDSEGDEYTKYGVDVCSLYEVEFTLDDLDY